MRPATESDPAAQIRRRADGSIDLEFHVDRARRLRSAATRRLLWRLIAELGATLRRSRNRHASPESRN